MVGKGAVLGTGSLGDGRFPNFSVALGQGSENTVFIVIFWRVVGGFVSVEGCLKGVAEWSQLLPLRDLLDPRLLLAP